VASWQVMALTESMVDAPVGNGTSVEVHPLPPWERATPDWAVWLALPALPMAVHAPSLGHDIAVRFSVRLRAADGAGNSWAFEMIDRGLTEVDVAAERALSTRGLAAPAASEEDTQPALASASDRKVTTAPALRLGSNPRWLWGRLPFIPAPCVDMIPPEVPASEL
jgi:hypothetical protein